MGPFQGKDASLALVQLVIAVLDIGKEKKKYLLDGIVLQKVSYNQKISAMAVTSYDFYYFEVHGLSRVCRLLLDLSGVKWTDTYVKVN